MKSLNKAFDILELFFSNDGEMALADIVKQSHLNKTTVSRIVSTMVRRGYLKQREKRGKYSLSTVFFNFSGAIKEKIKMRDIAIPHLVKLSRLIGESVSLAVWDGKEAVLTGTVHPVGDSYKSIKVVLDEEARTPLHCTSVGKIFLANMAEEEVQQYFSKGDARRFTPNTITDVNIMKEHLSIVQKDGIAYDAEEYAIGIRGISVALKNSQGHIIGAITILAPSVRLTRTKIEKLSQAVKNCAVEISRDL